MFAFLAFVVALLAHYRLDQLKQAMAAFTDSLSQLKADQDAFIAKVTEIINRPVGEAITEDDKLIVQAMAEGLKTATDALPA